ncbi:hypothetical protein GW17_00011324 [Ensete ventricosum]|nr:hypothetical protein GW17_00011324 [Ensete ventricosum]
MPPAAYCQGCCKLVGSSHSLCHAACCSLSGALQAGRPVASALSRGQSPAVKGAVGWSARRVRSAMPPTARCQGRCGVVGPSRPFCHTTNRPLSGALQVGQPVASALSCGQLHCLSGARDQVHYGSIGTSDLPTVFVEVRSESDVRPT